MNPTKIKQNPALKLLIIYFVILFSCITSCSQDENDDMATFFNVYGGLDDDEIYALIETEDGHYIGVGYTRKSSDAHSDVYYFKIDKQGTLIWSQSYGFEFDDIGRDICALKDGGFVILATHQQYRYGWYDDDIILIKINGDGQIVWSEIIGEVYDDEIGNSIIEANDGNLIITGYGHILKTDSRGREIYNKVIQPPGFCTEIIADNNDGFLISGTMIEEYSTTQVGMIWKINDDGIVIWYKTFGNNELTIIQSIKQVSDDGYILCGGTDVYNAADQIYVVRTNSNFESLWIRAFGLDGKYWNHGYSIAVANDNEFILCGGTASLNEGDDIMVMKIDAEGNKIWSETYGGNQYDRAFSIVSLEDDFIICGTTSSFGAGKKDSFVLRMNCEQNVTPPADNSAQIIEFSKLFGGAFGEDIIETSDNGYILCGSNVLPDSYGYYGTGFLRKLGRDGSNQWMRNYGEQYDSMILKSVIQIEDGDYLACGSIRQDDNPNRDLYILRTDQNGGILWQQRLVSETNDSAVDILSLGSKFLLFGNVKSLDRTMIVKGTNDGAIEWVKTISSEANLKTNCAKQTIDGDVILCGKSYGNSFREGLIFLMKLDSDGVKIWEKKYDYGEGNSVAQTDDGGFILTGVKEYLHTFGIAGGDIYTIKTDTHGNEEWSKQFSGPFNDEGFSILQRLEGGYILCGFTESSGPGRFDSVLILTDENGNIQYEHLLGAKKYNELRAICRTSNGGYALFGSSYWSHSRFDNDGVLLVKINAE